MRKKRIYILFLFFSIFAMSVSCKEKSETFASVNPLFLGDFEYPWIEIIFLKNKVFHKSDESYTLDSNGRRSYGDTYSPTVYNYYYYFDSKGRVIRWLSETVQDDQVITSNDYSYQYNDNEIIIKTIGQGRGIKQPRLSEDIIVLQKKDDSLVFTKKEISGSSPGGFGFNFLTKTVKSDNVITEEPKGYVTYRTEYIWLKEKNNWTTVQYIDNEPRQNWIRTFSGFLMENTLFANVEQTKKYSVVDGIGVYQYIYDGVLKSESILERRVNPAGFLEFEQITDKNGGVTTRRAQIIDAKE